jgi:hypothetical protein
MCRLVLIGLLALVFASDALAKGAVQVCGPAACVQLADETTPPTWLFGGSGEVSRVFAVPAPASYYVIRFADVRTTLAYWIPSSAMLEIVSQAGVGVWMSAPTEDQAQLRHLTNGVEPFAAPTRADVYVNGNKVKAATATFLRLFTIGTRVAPPTRVSWLPIWVGGGSSPWTDARADFRISKTGAYLWRNGLVLKIPAATAKKIRTRQPLG